MTGADIRRLQSLISRYCLIVTAPGPDEEALPTWWANLPEFPNDADAVLDALTEECHRWRERTLSAKETIHRARAIRFARQEYRAHTRLLHDLEAACATEVAP